MTAPDWLQLCDDIDDGEFDTGLEEIARAVASRRDIVHRRNARRLQRSLAKGDRVMITNKPTPRFLDGMVGSVHKIQDGAAVVLLDEMPVRRGAGRPAANEQKMSQKVLIALVHLVKMEEGVTSARAAVKDADIGDDEDYEADEEEDEEDEDDDD